MSSHAMLPSRLGGKVLDADVIQRAMIIIFLFVLVVLSSWFVFVLFGYSPIDSLFEVVSATGTVGLTSGITQASLPLLLKMLLCFDMLAGRLEIIALLVVLYPRTWIGKRMEIS